MNLFKLLAFIFFLWGVPMLAFTTKPAHEAWQRSLRLKTAEGRVAASRVVYVNERYDETNDRYTPGYYGMICLIRFVDDEGRRREFESNVFGEENAPRTGDRVEVIYDPSSTGAGEDAGINNPPVSRWGMTAFLFAANLAIILLPAVLFLAGKHVERRTLARLVNGKVTATRSNA